MSADSGSRSTAYSRTLAQAVEEMHAARARFTAERLHGDISARTYIQFEAAVINLVHELRHYARREDHTAKLWKESNLEHIEEVCGKETTSASTQTSGGKRRIKPNRSIDHAPKDVLLECSKALDVIADELDLTVQTGGATRRKGMI